MSARPSFPDIVDCLNGGSLPEGRAAQIPTNAVPGIRPVDGWVLVEDEEEDGDHFWRPSYVAVSGDERMLLGVSRWGFTPTQARFEFLVRSRFPIAHVSDGGGLAPYNDASIDAGIASAALGEVA